MANTINSNYIVKDAGKNTVRLYWTLLSDGSNETNTIVYNSSTIATALGIPNPSHCSVLSVCASVSSASGQVKFLFKASTNVVAFVIPNTSNHLCKDYEHMMGGLPNYAGSGITGDIVVTTTGLSSGDAIDLLLEVRAV